MDLKTSNGYPCVNVLRNKRPCMLKNKPVTKIFGGNSRPCNSKEIDKFG